MRDEEKSTRRKARELRKTMTRAEVILWTRLRRHQLGGFRFHRQYAIGPFIADFACVEMKLVIEVDGDTHSTDSEISSDHERTRFLEREGWRVLRCWNRDVYDNLDGTLEAILLTLRRQI